MEFIIFVLLILAIAFGGTYLSTLHSFSKAKEYLGETVIYKIRNNLFSPRITLKVMNVTHDFFQPYIHVKILDGEQKDMVTTISFQDFLNHKL